eukprot:COSAG01_NODE_1158_length_11469_cov_101.645646_10_plen_50_part_00
MAFTQEEDNIHVEERRTTHDHAKVLASVEQLSVTVIYLFQAKSLNTFSA